MEWIIDRLKEQSTWSGISHIGVMAGISPIILQSGITTAQAVIAAIVAIVSFIRIVKPEK